MKLRQWTRWRVAIAVLSAAVVAAPLHAGADIQGGLANGYSDNFDYPNVSLTNNAPLDATKWQTVPVGVTGQPIPNIWVVGGVQTSTLGEPGSEIKALKQQTTGAGASEPIAFVRNGNWQNVVAQVRASFVGPSQNSGIGLIFRAPVDPLTGTADKNNYYLFTAVHKTADQRDCFTGRCYFLIKRIGGAFFLMSMSHTYLNFVNPSGPAESHVYKVVMSGSKILAYVDGQLVLEFDDTPDDDINGIFSAPGPMFANGTVGVRTSNTKAWFDDFIVMGDNPRSYEARAAAMATYGQVGAGTNGTVIRQTGADTGFQYHDHDYGATPASAEGTLVAPVSPTNGVTGGALVSTAGQDGTVTSTARLLGFSGTMTQSMPDGSTVDVTLASDAISSTATASCEATSTKVELLNLSYLIVVKNAAGLPILNEGKVTQVNPPPNTVVEYPSGSGGYVKITLNAQKVTSDPRRADVSAVRIDFLQRPASVSSGNSTVADTGITTASVNLANVVAGRLCTPVI